MAPKLGSIPPNKGKYYFIRDGLKRCCFCKEWKPLSDFYKRRNYGCGLQTSCKPCARIREKTWRKKYPFRLLKNTLVRNSKNQGYGEAAGISEESLEKRYSSVGGICYICNLRIPVAYVSFDHVHSLRRGGENSIDNLLPVHRGCNAAKGELSAGEVLAWRLQ